LFANAIQPWKFEPNPEKNNENIEDTHRFYAPLEYLNRIILVKITVKEMKNKKDGSRIYSIQSIGTEIK
jgi:hypothetical protein